MARGRQKGRRTSKRGPAFPSRAALLVARCIVARAQYVRDLEARASSPTWRDAHRMTRPAHKATRRKYEEFTVPDSFFEPLPDDVIGLFEGKRG